MREHRSQPVRVAGDAILRTHRDHDGTGDRTDFGARERLARAPDASRESGAVGTRLLGERAEHALHRVLQILERGRLHRVGYADRQADAVDEMIAQPAQHQRSHEFGALQREKARNPGAHRVAHHVGARNAQVIEQVAGVLGHAVRAIGVGIVELLAAPMAAIVERDHPSAGLGQRIDPARIDPVDPMAGREAMHQQDRFAQIRLDRRDVDKGNPHAVGGKFLHHSERPVEKGAAFA